jgi:hypothetical protein
MINLKVTNNFINILIIMQNKFEMIKKRNLYKLLLVNKNAISLNQKMIIYKINMLIIRILKEYIKKI